MDRASLWIRMRKDAHTYRPQRKYSFLNCHDQLENYTEKVGGSNFTFVGLNTSTYQEAL